MESMAMEIPTIATNWSGNTQFMNSQNSFLIPVERMINATTSGHLWALPSLLHLKAAMRSVYKDRSHAKDISIRYIRFLLLLSLNAQSIKNLTILQFFLRARRDITTYHSVDKLAQQAVQQIKDIYTSGRFAAGKQRNSNADRFSAWGSWARNFGGSTGSHSSSWTGGSTWNSFNNNNNPNSNQTPLPAGKTRIKITE